MESISRGVLRGGVEQESNSFALCSYLCIASSSLFKFADVIGSAQACGLRQAHGGDMTGDQFAALLDEITLSAESGDGARFAGHFTEDAIYYDYIYGAHKGRAEIAHLMQNLFHRDAADYRWEMFDPVFDGEKGYAWSLSSFTSKIPQLRSEEHTSELQSHSDLVCRLLLEKKKIKYI